MNKALFYHPRQAAGENPDGGVAYPNLSVNGKTLDLYIKMSDNRYMGAWIENFND